MTTRAEPRMLTREELAHIMNRNTDAWSGADVDDGKMLWENYEEALTIAQADVDRLLSHIDYLESQFLGLSND